MVNIRLRYCGSWYKSSAKDLSDYLQTKYKSLVNIIHNPEELANGEAKPFEVSVNNRLVYSKLMPVNGEQGPITFKYNKWTGEPDPAKVEQVEREIEKELK